MEFVHLPLKIFKGRFFGGHRKAERRQVVGCCDVLALRIGVEPILIVLHGGDLERGTRAVVL